MYCRMGTFIIMLFVVGELWAFSRCLCLLSLSPPPPRCKCTTSKLQRRALRARASQCSNRIRGHIHTKIVLIALDRYVSFAFAFVCRKHPTAWLCCVRQYTMYGQCLNSTNWGSDSPHIRPNRGPDLLYSLYISHAERGPENARKVPIWFSNEARLGPNWGPGLLWAVLLLL